VSAAVKSVSKVQRHADGSVTRQILSTGSGTRRVSKRYRKADRLLRKIAKAQNIASGDYLARHAKSNAKKKDGARKQLPRNVHRAIRKGVKSL
jgi:hypothetical protein